MSSRGTRDPIKAKAVTARYREKRRNARVAEIERQRSERISPPAAIIAWASGYFDGEGTATFAVYRNKGVVRLRPCITVSSIDIESINVLKNHWGGCIVVRAKLQLLIDHIVEATPTKGQNLGPGYNQDRLLQMRKLNHRGRGRERLIVMPDGRTVYESARAQLAIAYERGVDVPLLGGSH